MYVTSEIMLLISYISEEMVKSHRRFSKLPKERQTELREAVLLL